MFDQAQADAICERLADGDSLRSICAEDPFPSKSEVFRWLADPANQGFRDQYARAREAQADALADEMLDIADDATNDWMERQGEDKRGPGWDINGEHVQRTKLRLDTRKWIASKLKPKVYGEKVDLTSGGEKIGLAETLAARRVQAAEGRE